MTSSAEKKNKNYQDKNDDKLIFIKVTFKTNNLIYLLSLKY